MISNPSSKYRQYPPIQLPNRQWPGRVLTHAEIDWLTLFGERGDDLLSAIAIAVGKPRQWVDDLAADEAILLAAKVIEVNADFFTRTVMPKLDGLFTQAKSLAPAPVPAAPLGPVSGSMPSSA